MLLDLLRRRGRPPAGGTTLVAAGRRRRRAPRRARRVAVEPAFGQEADELLRAVANQLAVALHKAELIERLTAENIVRDLFEALESGTTDVAEARARAAGCDLGRAPPAPPRRARAGPR